MLAFRSVQQGEHCVREEFLYELKASIVSVRSFSTNSRPALRAAACGGRPRAGSDTAATPGANLTERSGRSRRFRLRCPWHQGMLW
jgi:hypothetical protein